MRQSILLAAVLGGAVSTVAQAGNTLAQEAVAVPQVKSAKPAPQVAAKSVRLSDEELDKVTAGKAIHDTGDGITFVNNPGKASFEPKILHRNILCINLCL